MSSKQNSPNYGRFKDLEWFKPISEARIFIGGAGGIGSWLALQLARTGADIIILDDDTVDTSNLAGQCYGPNHVGKKKVESIKDVVKFLTGDTIHTFDTRIKPEDIDGGVQWVSYMSTSNVTCVTFDNIATRKLVFEIWLEAQKSREEPALFVDCRMGAENGEVFVVPSHDVISAEAYRLTLFDDSEVPDAPCTAKATTHCGSMIASFAVAQIANWFNNLVSVMQRPVVGHFSFQLMVMQFKKEKLKIEEDVTEQSIVGVQTTLVPV